MRRRSIVLLSALIGAAVVVLTAGPALAQPIADMQIAKHRSGPYAGNDEYFNDHTVINATIPSGESKSFYLKVKNEHSDTDDYVLEGSPNPLGWKLKWFKGTTNITSDVQGGTFDFSVAPDHTKRFRMKVKAGGGGACVITEVSHEQSGTPLDRASVAVNAADACVL